MRALRIRGSLRERNYVRTVSLVTYQEDTPLYTMYATRDSPSFISTVSLTPDAFDILVTQFKKHYVVKSLPYRSGRPPRFQMFRPAGRCSSTRSSSKDTDPAHHSSPLPLDILENSFSITSHKTSG
ncbi:hypothetical protein H257_10795 [Aphanomyces astaci]|uniref:Uncharacterized protein n=1 Tax=Aphanomyces astaci TaxID=112090 RepID=W4G5V9_APHAT|nr:hypothetical protein H257_10795 [Aphanomyces astaci]ETV74671.1 hypothetical protein H257_10795 [Aphanomyces astaci]|eukprot:XP_009835758.1 hypothetical protein H257_10795 [Aphanomyces astaci]